MTLSRRTLHRIALGASAYAFRPAWARTLQDGALPEAQPFLAAVRRLLQALVKIGAPLPPETAIALNRALAAEPGSAPLRDVIALLDREALLQVTLNPEMRVSAMRGSAPAVLVQGGWSTFLVRVDNHAGTTTTLHFRSPQGGPVGRRSSLAIEGVHDFTNGAVDAVESRQRWLALDTFDAPPMTPSLSGLTLEYRILRLYGRDAGKREATLTADAGWGEQDLGFRSSVPILFDCRPSQRVRLQVLDEHGEASIAAITVHDKQWRVYPPMQKRDLPDLNFQPQVYRYSGEDLLLPEGEFTVTYTRGPEYLRQQQSLRIAADKDVDLQLRLKRWIDPKSQGYYSGDTHIHAAGCSHYESPTEGVVPVVMQRQVDGEALDLGSVLNWGPGYRYQEQFFTGHAEASGHASENSTATAHAGMHHDAEQAAANQTRDIAEHFAGPKDRPQSLLRYDVEVSGFPSSHCGHLVLLQLRQDNYPGAAGLEDWPSWNLPILRWAKSQGAVVGYAHSAHGLVVNSTELPNYIVPPFNSMGANEFIADVTHPGIVDFISGCDLWPFAELNIWYHTLNCGFRTAFAGETDFPCITDERVGGGRSYVSLPHAAIGDAGYAAWIEGLVHGDSYVGDGRSHIFGFSVNGNKCSLDDVPLTTPGKVLVTATVCARLEEEITPQTRAIQTASPFDKPYWHLERARIEGSRDVPVEVICNGEVAATVHVLADGTPQPLRVEIDVTASSWIALRVPQSAHTNPIFITVAGKPVRASHLSAQWCREGVDVCWGQKRQRIRVSELAAAETAFDHARRTYDRILAEMPESILAADNPSTTVSPCASSPSPDRDAPHGGPV